MICSGSLKLGNYIHPTPDLLKDEAEIEHPDVRNRGP
ncbi:Peroxisomal membrane protein PEX16 [Psidium guajava]|nr:Peroxisomal membrane protein PEX16 [Psidium guajava]